MSSKMLQWVAGAHKEYAQLPKSVQQEFGHALWLAQKGDKAAFAKPLKGFGGADVIELKNDRSGEAYRAIYTVRFGDAVYVLAAIHKKSTKGIGFTQKDAELIRKRLQQAKQDYDRRNPP